MSGNELTLGAVLAQLEDQEHEIATRSEAARRRIAELTAQLEEFHQVAQEIRITRKTLLALPDPSPPTPPAAKLPDHLAYRQIMAVLAAADAPLRARAVCEAMDLEIAAQQRQQRPDEAPAAGRTRDPDRARAGIVHPATAVATRARWGTNSTRRPRWLRPP
ncbi:hypothetical protein AB0M86_28760 [Streptomyces sp. NPDC051639]|uniref:hypothetical protein n=1 Tax=unclassified Streptomyces TaxID=2593676 RepID=UPI002E335F4A|nr:hypothetical protein [Streptomyces sp. NBC_01455]